MTTSNGMSNFKRLAERLARGGKLITAQEKLAAVDHGLYGESQSKEFISNWKRPTIIQLVPTPVKKARSQ